MEDREDFFDRKAHRWEEVHYPPAVRERLAALVLRFGVRAGGRVLDLGTGPGVLIPYLRRQTGPEGRVCSLDLSFPMVRQAARKPLLPGDLVLQGDAHHLPFQAEAFDHVVCFAAFPHFHAPRQALKEMARTVRRGGTVTIAHLMSRDELARHHSAHGAVARDALPDEARMSAWLAEAGLHPLSILDEPGRYLARAVKR